MRSSRLAARTKTGLRPRWQHLALAASAIALAALAACGSTERIDPPMPPPPDVLYKRAPPPVGLQRPPSSFSRLIDEAKKRRKLIERLEKIEGSIEP